MFLRNSLLRSPIARTMTTLTPVATKTAPLPAAPYSQAIKTNNMIFVSGQIPYTADNKPIEGSMTDKAEQVMENVGNILKASNSSFEKVAKVNVFLADMKDFGEFNNVYSKYFTTHKPARSCVAVKTLPLNVDVEVEVIAVEND